VVRAVFLDRDGVINANLERNGKPVAPTRFTEFRILPGVEKAARELKAAGFLLVVVTNQPDVATGRTARDECEAMHVEIRRKLPIDDIIVCFHVDADNCACRKPKPGMIFEAAAKYGIDLARSYIVGDRWRDVRAGQAVGCCTLFVDYGYPQDQTVTPDHVVASLEDAAAFILKQEAEH
jgi:D-glycero-D-manno-heptose 1,7-bisphosphate phosphatase